MKRTISLAMLLIGMVGAAQTMNNPVIVRTDETPKNKVWYRYEDDSTITYFSNTNRTEAIAYSNALVIQFLGDLEKSARETKEDDIEIYEWEISDTMLLQLVLREERSLIVIIEIAEM
jgi:hypothetical protein